jgi:ferredoxin-thioredoxin reductase catalytic subunit
MNEVTEEEITQLYERLKKDEESAGYHFNPDLSVTRELIKGLIINTRRYGYPSCPCRLASGKKSEDMDIICPCYYRDPDVVEHGACYCSLYVSQKVLKGEQKLAPVPERRPPPEKRSHPVSVGTYAGKLTYPVWRCQVCGYLRAHEEPPEICPICKAKKERFERFM